MSKQHRLVVLAGLVAKSEGGVTIELADCLLHMPPNLIPDAPSLRHFAEDVVSQFYRGDDCLSLHSPLASAYISKWKQRWLPRNRLSRLNAAAACDFPVALIRVRKNGSTHATGGIAFTLLGEDGTIKDELMPSAEKALGGEPASTVIQVGGLNLGLLAIPELDDAGEVEGCILVGTLFPQFKPV